MGRTSGSHSDITGPKIRKSALRLFAQHGFAAVSMRQIAADVGVQVGAIYNYIPDKQTLLFHLMRDHMTALLAAQQDDPTAAAPSRLREFVRFHIQFHHERPDEVFIAYMELRNLSAENFAVIEELRKTYETRLETILKAGQAEGVFAPRDAKLGTFAVIAMLTGVSTWFRPDGRLSLMDVQDHYLEMVQGALGMTAAGR